MLFTTEQATELAAIVDHYHLLWAANAFGVNFLTPEDVARLSIAGIDITELPREGLLDEAFRFGLLSMGLDHAQNLGLNYEEFTRFLKRGGALPMTRGELAALTLIKRQAYHDIKGLGNKVGHQVGSWLIEADRRQRARLEATIRDKAADAIARRETRQWLASELGHATNDWSRDWGRISDYLMHSAFDAGRAEEIRRQHGVEAQVYKQPYDQACKHCVRLLLTAGAGSPPRLFSLNEIVGNGSNVGRKVADWKATLGPIHPWCRCTLHHADTKRNDYDPKTKGWTKAKPYVRDPAKPPRKRGNVTITINGQTHTV